MSLWLPGPAILTPLTLTSYSVNGDRLSIMSASCVGGSEVAI